MNHRFLALLSTLLICVCARAVDYRIVFNSGNADSSSPTVKLSDIVAASSYDFVAGINAQRTRNIYRAKPEYGIKGGTGSIGGQLHLLLDTAYTIRTVTLYAAAYSNKADTATTRGLRVQGHDVLWRAPRTTLQAYTVALNLTTDTLHIGAILDKNNRFYIEHIELDIEDTYSQRGKVQMPASVYKFPSMEYDSLLPAEDSESFSVVCEGMRPEGLSVSMRRGTTFSVSPTTLPAEGGDFAISYSSHASPSYYDIVDTCIITGIGLNGATIRKTMAVSVMIYEPRPYVEDTTGKVVSVAPLDNYYVPLNGLCDSLLKSTLGTIIHAGPRFSYGSGNHHTWAAFYYTDRDTMTDAVLDMYSDAVRYFNPERPTASVAGFDIEHMLPKSWWGGTVNDAYCDLYHLVPGDYSANRSKSNHAPGIVTDTTFWNGSFATGADAVHGISKVFCPADEYKGDFARAYFYIATCYGDELTWVATEGSEPALAMDNNSYLEFRPWLYQLLLTWHRQDPVSEKELLRAIEVNKIQGNRNPFIDYPDLAEFIWGNRRTESVQMDILPCSYTSYLPTAEPSLNILPRNEQPAKILLNGSLMILREGKKYTIWGLEE